MDRVEVARLKRWSSDYLANHGDGEHVLCARDVQRLLAPWDAAREVVRAHANRPYDGTRVSRAIKALASTLGPA